ncbi:putative auxin-responsive protein IAA28 [Phragmites australis]|uniref:putative auxin-responsive protein IAA28 n=1 Tax=Phragmites australis TaxID=29695 RepID=UPI002D7685E6|nr:putative auxin-responsive protein IAA28 [Phragmites australis]
MKSMNASIELEAEVKPRLSSSRFVKVFMQGEVVGRKINLAVHKSYASLSFTLKRLGNNYSMPSCELNDGLVNNEEDDASYDNNFILFHDNVEGDRFFLGEVPWELFTISVKRIYIVPMEQENEFVTSLHVTIKTYRLRLQIMRRKKMESIMMAMVLLLLLPRREMTLLLTDGVADDGDATSATFADDGVAEE